MRASVLLLVLGVTATSLRADCVGSSLEPHKVEAIAHATTLEALDRAYAKFGAGDAALRALYRRRRLHVNPTTAEELGI